MKEQKLLETFNSYFELDESETYTPFVRTISSGNLTKEKKINDVKNMHKIKKILAFVDKYGIENIFYAKPSRNKEGVSRYAYLLEMLSDYLLESKQENETLQTPK